MNDKVEKEVYKVTPLKRICMTIGELPSSYLETMTYYEMLVWFTNFLRDNVIPTVNNNAEAVQELQTLYEELRVYVNDYFDNLDVQEEINNKLDDMLEDGVLEQIIEQFLQLTSLICFDNVADMKTSVNLANGSYAKTLGYYSKNDGGSALYKIRTITNEDIVDESFIIALNDNTLIAELIIDEFYVEKIGAKGDGIVDDTAILQKGINYATTNNLVLKSHGDKTYLITTSLNFTNKIDMDFNNSTIKTNNAINMLVFNYPTGNEYQGFLKNIVIDMNNVALTGILGTRIIKKLISGITIKNISNIAYQIDLGNEVILENSHFYGSSNTSIGLMLNKGDCHYKDIIMIDVHNAIYTKSSNFFERIHAWIKTPSLISDSIFFKSDTTNESFLNQCYSDTYFKAFQIERYHRLKISEHYNHYNTTILNSEVLTNIGGYVYFAYYTDTQYSQYTSISNSIIEGINGSTEASLLTNLGDNKLMFIDSNTRLQDITSNKKYITNTAINITSESVELSSGKNNSIKTLNNISNLSLYVRIKTQITANTNTQILTFNSQYAPTDERIFIAPFGFELGYKASGYVFCTLTNTGSLSIISDVNLPVNARIYINQTYINNISC